VQPSRQALSYLEQKTASIQSAEFQYSPTKKEEAEQVAKSLCDAGKTANAHYCANEGNGFTKRENQIDAISSHDRSL
jgi:hypothetical protein